MTLVPVILAGGRGERFWPLSRAGRPKQFLSLDGTGRSLLRATAERLLPLAGGWGGLLVVTAAPLVEGVRAHLPELPDAGLLVEPEGRDTAPAVALAALAVRERFGPEAVLAVFPADHWIGDEEAFHRAVRAAAELAAARGVLVTFGVPPSYPATGYGYIERGEPLGAEGEPLAPGGGSREGEGPAPAPGAPVQAYRVARFTEKPDAQTAAAYVAGGRHYWNSGIFVWRADAVLEELRRHAPEVIGPLADAYPERVAEVYPRLPRISIDYALMERTDRAVVVPAPFAWDDLGDWTALERVLRGDSPNVVVGRHVGLDTRGAILYTTGDDLIVTVGLEDVVIVRDGEITLIARKDRVQELKQVLARLRGDPALARYV